MPPPPLPVYAHQCATCFLRADSKVVMTHQNQTSQRMHNGSAWSIFHLISSLLEISREQRWWCIQALIDPWDPLFYFRDDLTISIVRDECVAVVSVDRSQKLLLRKLMQVLTLPEMIMTSKLPVPSLEQTSLVSGPLTFLLLLSTSNSIGARMTPSL